MSKIEETFFEWLDFLLPENFRDRVSVRFYYRARILVTINIVTTFLITAVFLISLKFIQRSNIPKIGIGLISLYLICTIIYLKNIKSNFEKKFFCATLLQLILLVLVIYFVGFSSTGLGFFGMIWFMPVLLMLAYYFDHKLSLAYFMLFLASFIYVIVTQHQNFFLPIARLPKFSKIYEGILVVNFILVFGLSYIYSILMEQLQYELSNQRELLIASAKFNSLGKMTTTMAHDINNPLFTLQNKLQQILNLINQEQIDKNRCEEIINSAVANIEKLSAIVRGISNYAREGRVDEMIVMSASDLVKSNLDIIFDNFDKNGITLKFESTADVDIICHPSYLSQVILNLIQNGIDALEKSEKKEISIRVEKVSTDVLISIVDTGPGISEDNLEKIFKPFFTTKNYQKGTGLGLSISQGLVELHHGKIRYIRNQDMTCFLIQLPHADSLMSSC